MVATKRRSGLRVPLAILALIALGIVATTGSVKTSRKTASVNTERRTVTLSMTLAA